MMAAVLSAGSALDWAARGLMQPSGDVSWNNLIDSLIEAAVAYGSAAGAAVLAGVASGLWESVVQGATAMKHAFAEDRQGETRIEPDPESAMT